MSIFKGSGVAIITPFNEDETINYKKLENLIEYQIENSTDAIIICGTTGESSTLTDKEQIECIKFTVEKVNKRIPVIAGCGSNDTKHTIKLASACQKVGADATLIVTPYYNKTTQKGIISHYKMISENIDIPIILYNVPSRTGLNILPQTCYELSKIKNIIGIKEASGNISQIAEISSICGSDFDIYSGNDDQILPVLSLGGKGVISVLANIAPKETHNMVVEYLNGNIKEATKLQLKSIELINALFCETNPIPIKKALNILGLEIGKCKMPLCEMEEKNIIKLEKALKNYGLIK